MDDSTLPNQQITNDPAQAPPASSNAPAPQASPSTPSVSDTQQPTSPLAQQSGDTQPISFPQNPSRSVKPSQGQVVSNVQQPTEEVHPAVKRASVLYDIAQALAGGPRYTEAIDEN